MVYREYKKFQRASRLESRMGHESQLQVSQTPNAQKLLKMRFYIFISIPRGNIVRIGDYENVTLAFLGSRLKKLKKIKKIDCLIRQVCNPKRKIKS
jgi:hypothetical protein